MRIFEKIKTIMIPKINEYMKKEVLTDFCFMDDNENKQEFKSEMIKLNKELDTVLKNRDVVDKTIKYDEQARS